MWCQRDCGTIPRGGSPVSILLSLHKLRMTESTAHRPLMAGCSSIWLGGRGVAYTGCEWATNQHLGSVVIADCVPVTTPNDPPPTGAHLEYYATTNQLRSLSPGRHPINHNNQLTITNPNKWAWTLTNPQPQNTKEHQPKPGAYCST